MGIHVAAAQPTGCWTRVGSATQAFLHVSGEVDWYQHAAFPRIQVVEPLVRDVRTPQVVDTIQLLSSTLLPQGDFQASLLRCVGRDGELALEVRRVDASISAPLSVCYAVIIVAPVQCDTGYCWHWAC